MSSWRDPNNIIGPIREFRERVEVVPRPRIPPAAAAAQRPPVDYTAKAEAKEFEEGHYERLAKRNQHRRGESAKGVLHWATLTLLCLGLLIFAAMNVVLLIHMIGHANHRWLSTDDLSVLKHLVGVIWAGQAGMLLKRFNAKHSGDEQH